MLASSLDLTPFQMVRLSAASPDWLVEAHMIRLRSLRFNRFSHLMSRAFFPMDQLRLCSIRSNIQRPTKDAVELCSGNVVLVLIPFQNGQKKLERKRTASSIE